MDPYVLEHLKLVLRWRLTGEMAVREIAFGYSLYFNCTGFTGTLLENMDHVLRDYGYCVTEWEAVPFKYEGVMTVYLTVGKVEPTH